MSKVVSFELEMLTSKTIPADTKVLQSESNLEHAEFLDHFLRIKPKHWLQKNEATFENDLRLVEALQDSANNYFQDNKWFTASPVETFHMQVNDKAKVVDETSVFLDGKCNQAGIDASRAILEELLMNAVYDAPREALKEAQKNSSTIKTVNPPELEILMDADNMLISCIDWYGSLKGDLFLGRLKEVYKHGAGQVIQLEGPGAGIGCSILFENSSHLFLGVHKNVLTKVSCILPRTASNKKRSSIKKSLHLIEVEK